ncbi:MAG TPA: condensation domain-containing protein, partial [Kofleriaceae bacterium]|nr:condensation domain-containing protein [Kofleriaceae bacterium]
MVLLGDAVMRIYDRLLAGDAAGAAESAGDAPSYLEFVARDRQYLASSRYHTDEQFWHQYFADLPPPLFAVRHGDAAPSDRVLWRIDAPRLARVKQIAAARGCTVQHFMHALIAAYFARTRRVDDIVFGVPVHNRTTGRDKRTVGMFSSMIPVRTRVDREGAFGELMRGIAAELRRCYRYQRFPLAELNRMLRLAQLGRTQIFDVTVAHVGFVPPRAVGGTTFALDRIYGGFEQTPLAVAVRDYVGGDDTVIELEYNTRAFQRDEIEHVRRRLERMMDAVLAGGDDQPLTALPLIDDAERTLVVETWNATARPFPPGQCVHELVEAQVARTPHAIAVIDGERELRYDELDARANQLAAQLRALGTGPDVPVGLCLERSAEMVIGLLAVLKAGGCYVPLDPDYPVDRVREMVDDAAPAVVLVDDAGERVMAQIDDRGAPVRLHVVTDAARWAALPAQEDPRDATRGGVNGPALPVQSGRESPLAEDPRDATCGGVNGPALPVQSGRE